MTTLQLGKRLWRTLTKRQRTRVLLLVIAVIVMAVLEVVNVSAIAPFLAVASDPTMIESNAILSFLYDYLSFQSVDRFLVAIGLAVFALMLLSNAWMALTTWAQLRLVWSWNHQLSVRLLRRYLYQPYSYFLSRNTADLSKNLLSEVQQITNQMVKPAILAVGKAIVAVGIVTVLVVMNPMLALLVTVVVGGSYGAIYVGVRKKLRVIGRDRVKANTERFTVAGEALGGIKDVKVLNVEHAFLGRFTVPSRRFSRRQATNQAIGVLPRHAIETVAFGSVILIVVFLIALERDFGSIVPTLGVYAFAGYRLMPALQQIFQGITQARFNASALETILTELENGSDTETGETPKFASPMGLKHSLQLDNVRYTYPSGHQPAIDGVSLTIPVNTAVGFVGATGSGKTTLADLILGLLRPQSGRILVDGEAVSGENLSAWQATLGYVPQHIFLSDASVAENIAFGVPKEQIDSDAVRAAAHIAQIDQFVMHELPKQYDTVVGERGIRLSGGQRQRIGIARALYRNPSVILFDEATSAVDNTTEDHIMEAMQSLLGSRTIIMIAHRVATLADCDTIFMIDHGKVVAEGSYEDLVAGEGGFSEAARGAGGGHRRQVSSA